MSYNLSEQELVRRESLQKIKDLGINPFPAAEVNINFKTTDFTSVDFFANLVKEVEKLKARLWMRRPTKVHN